MHWVRIKPWFVVVAITLLVGCSGGMKTSYVDPSSQSEALGLYFNQKDLQILAQTMVGELVETPIFGADRPTVRISDVQNKTDEHIDTKAITDTIRTRLVRSGKVRFVSDVSEEKVRQQATNELAYAHSAVVDADSGPRMGRMQAAQYHLYGQLISLTSAEGRVKERYYKFTLSLKNVETGVLEWADEREILKRGQKRIVGW